MHYFVNTEKGLKIMSFSTERRGSWYTKFTQEQEDFIAQYPDATIQEVKSLHKNVPYVKNLEDYKREKIAEIEAYDCSDAVNQFFYNGTPMWFDKATRVGLINSLNSAEIMNLNTISLWYNDIFITVDIPTARQLLAAIEIYAMECFNVTAGHKVNVSELTEIDDVIAYNYTTGYPSKLQLGE